jgi:hypothetical protein
MDSFFATHVPDISQWGALKMETLKGSRKYLCKSLNISISAGSPNYSDVVHEIARSIASARLRERELRLWEEAVLFSENLSVDDQEVIARAITRGICKSGSDWRLGVPTWNEDNFKGHLVEVLLFSLQIFLSSGSGNKLHIFEPTRPKAMTASGGIDLLEVGEHKGEYYFQVWECKGTDVSVRGAYSDAAKQLVLSTGTAYQSFMEAHRSLQITDTIARNSALMSFISEMPKIFYGSNYPQKRLGAVVASGPAITSTDSQGFVGMVGSTVSDDYHHCQVIMIQINDFPQFRKDAYQHLWNIY